MDARVDAWDWLEPWRGKRVLVTGGTGFLGRHVVEIGRRAGVEILAQSVSGRRGILPDDVGLARVDLRDGDAVAELIHGFEPDGVIHLAAAGTTFGSDQLAEMIAVNAVGLATLLEASAKVTPTPHVVVASSCVEYAPQDRPIVETDRLAPYSPYGVSKVAATYVAEHYARRSPVTLVRMFHVYGDGEPGPRLAPHIVSCARQGIPVDLTACEQVRDYTYARDAAEGFWRALARPPEAGALRVINMGTGRAVTLKDYVLRLRDALAERGVRAELNIGAKPYRADEPMMYVADVGEARRLLGWTPPTGIEEGLRRTVDALL